VRGREVGSGWEVLLELFQEAGKGRVGAGELKRKRRVVRGVDGSEHPLQVVVPQLQAQGPSSAMDKQCA